MIKLIVGLGNKGLEYQKTRHNVGFMLLDAYAARHGATWQPKAKFKAEMAELFIDGQKVLLLKPHTYMNRSGEAVQLVRDFYKIENSEILVLHDELALPFGTIRARLGGSDAGNNGIKSLVQHIGSDFARVRVGILTPEMPIMGASDFVLDRFDPEELVALQSQHATVERFIDDFLNNRFTADTATH